MITDKIKVNPQEYVIMLLEDSVQVKFDSVAVIAKVWGIDVDVFLG